VALSKWPDVKDKLVQVGAWCRDGLTEKSICHNLGISEQTFNIYKHEHPELCEVLRKGKEVIDITVENALYRRCIGFQYDEVTSERTPVRDDDGIITGYEMIITKKVTKTVLADPVSCQWWLRNRKPIQWHDRREVETKIEVHAPVLAEVMRTFRTMRMLNKALVIDVIDGDVVTATR